MRRPSAANIDKLTRAYVKAIGQEFNYEIEIDGGWRFEGGDDGVSVMVTDQGTTLVKGIVKDGKSYRADLKRVSTSLPNQPQNEMGFKCTKINPHQYKIISSSSQPFNLSVLSPWDCQ